MGEKITLCTLYVRRMCGDASVLSMCSDSLGDTDHGTVVLCTVGVVCSACVLLVLSVVLEVLVLCALCMLCVFCEYSV